jgi:hypothetical protein
VERLTELLPSTEAVVLGPGRDYVVILTDGIRQTAVQFAEALQTNRSPAYAGLEAAALGAQRDALEACRRIGLDLMRRDFAATGGVSRERIAAQLLALNLMAGSRKAKDQRGPLSGDPITLEERALASEMASGIAPYATLARWASALFSDGPQDRAVRRVLLTPERTEMVKMLGKEGQTRAGALAEWASITALQDGDFVTARKLLTGFSILDRTSAQRLGKLILARPGPRAGGRMTLGGRESTP